MTIYPTLVSASVNDVLRMAPASAAVFNRFGVDTCCGGGLAIEDAAREAGVSLEELLAALGPIVSPPAGAAE